MEVPYKDLALRLKDKGFSVETEETTAQLFKTLEAAGFQVTVEGKTFKVYAARLIAEMHKATSGTKALEL